ncbi:MAG: hypothetical protein V5A57_00200 [Candidatus Paceibacterota bacterium]
MSLKKLVSGFLIGVSLGVYLIFMFLMGLLATNSFTVAIGCLFFTLASIMAVYLTYKFLWASDNFLNKPALVIGHLATLALSGLLASRYFIIPMFC